MTEENFPANAILTRAHDGRTMIGHVVVWRGQDEHGSDVIAVWQVNTACASTGAWVMPSATAFSDPSAARKVLDLCAQRALTTWDPSAKLPILSALAQVAAVTTQDWAATAVAVPKILAEVAAVRAANDKRIAEERQHRKNIVQAEWMVDIPDPIPATAEEFREYARLVRPPGASAVGEALLTASLLRWCRLRWQENMLMLGRREYLQQYFGRPRLLPAAWETRLADAYAG